MSRVRLLVVSIVLVLVAAVVFTILFWTPSDPTGSGSGVGMTCLPFHISRPDKWAQYVALWQRSLFAHNLTFFALIADLVWGVGLVIALVRHRSPRISQILPLCVVIVIAILVVIFWVTLDPATLFIADGCAIR